MFYSEITGKTYKTAGIRARAEAVTGKPRKPRGPMPLEQRKKISETRKRLFADPNYFQTMQRDPTKTYTDGYWVSDTGRKIISAYHKGRPKPESQKRKMSQAAKDVPKSPEHIAAIREGQARSWAASRGEEWAVQWYIDRGKEVPNRFRNK